MDDEIEDVPVPINNELEAAVAYVFELFDTAGNKTVEPHVVGTIVRALGCCPTDKELHEILEEIEDDTWPGLVHLSVFLPYICQCITAHKFIPKNADQLLEAFHVLDPEGHGYITKEAMSTFLTQDGEKFTQDELDEMLETAIDSYTQTIRYEDYIGKLIPTPPDEENLYKMADAIEARKPPPPPPPKTFSEMMAAQAALALADENN